MVAHQFNTAVANGQSPIVAYMQEDLPADVGMLDIEQGGKTDISDDYWLTGVTLSNHSWSYIDGQTYKDPALVIRNMIDVWSKRGIVLLNVSPRADGVINREQREVLAATGDAEFEEGHFGGQSATMQYTHHDIRFTRSKDGSAVYVYVLGRPEANTALPIRHLVAQNDGRTVEAVTVVGSGAQVDFALEGEEIILQTPAAAAMDEMATVFRVDVR
ncbi:alpha-L-fucosidase [Neolewinella xylanilytica]|uniref:alpha-L-fucosidase n=1 Tax=Neolewinella xylanilytica TaxID=1514080 RepID=UPI000CEB0B96|nr:alpha-L-fucosidase [Neolewinella xylanilytica]